MEIDPKYVAWRIARRVFGKEKPFSEVRKMRDLVLSSGLANKAIEELNAYLKRVDDTAGLILKDVGNAEVSAETKIPPAEDLLPATVLDVSTAFTRSASVTVTVTLHGKKWVFSLKAGSKPNTTTIADSFLKDYWPEAEKSWQTPPPITEALRRAESGLTNRIVGAVNESLGIASRPGSPIMLELGRRVHMNRISYHKSRMRTVVEGARNHSLSDDEISTMWKEILVEEVQES